MKTYSFRLTPGDDLKLGIEKFTSRATIGAGYILTCVGSLTEVVIRLAGATPEKQDIRSYRGHFEIVSLVGTVSINGCHLHMSFSDEYGTVAGGHLKEGSVVGTTAEVVLGEDENVQYYRELDPETGFPELNVYPR